MSKIPDTPPVIPAARQEGKRSGTRTELEAYFSGPLPTPSILEGYDRIVPGAAERILSMAEADAKHQREIEFAALNADIYSLRRGQILGCVVVLATLGVAAFCAYLGHEAAASVIGGTTVVGLATCFVLGRKKADTKEPTQKKK